jgi:GMP synthase (glutamine-hydrolysing)
MVRVELDAGDVLPDWRGFDGIIAMGGPMSVNDADAHPWLVDELEAIREAVRAGLPYWGVCLGAQLLAAALGGNVRRGATPEVGVTPVSLAPSSVGDPVFSACPAEFTALHWHGDTFDLPPGAALLASTPQYPHQALRWGQVAYGLQFHVETDASLAETWLDLDAYRQALTDVAGPSGPQDLMAAIGAAEAEMRDVSTDLFTRWLRLSETAPGRRPIGSEGYLPPSRVSSSTSS